MKIEKRLIKQPNFIWLVSIFYDRGRKRIIVCVCMCKRVRKIWGEEISMKNMIEEKRKKWNMWKERWRRQWQRGDQRIVRERAKRKKWKRQRVHSFITTTPILQQNMMSFICCYFNHVSILWNCNVIIQMIYDQLERQN